MYIHETHVWPEAAKLPKKDQLAWKFARIAAQPDLPIDDDVSGMIINRLIDNAGVALAAINRDPVKTARLQALAHPKQNGATLFGIAPSYKVEAEWAAWANGVAVRELDFHDTFLAADYSHPADNIPPLLSVAQQKGLDGADLIKGLSVAYEVHVALVTAICLHKHKIDHIAHLGPAAAAGIGAMLGLSADEIFSAINQALHVCCTTRQSRKGMISSWKAYAPAHAGKLAIEAVDRAMRGQGSPAPIYEGEDSVIAWMLDGPEASYQVPLPNLGEPCRAIMQTYTKAHSAEYQSQALIDLAFRMGPKVTDLTKGDWGQVHKIELHTSHHTHYVIGTGAGDPQKMDPTASRETLDHSIMYIFAVALQDGVWHHQKSYAPERAQRDDTVRLWHKIETFEDPEWTRRYHSADPAEKAFGAKVIIHLKNGQVLVDEIAVADAHPLGAGPYQRKDYIAKFCSLATEIAPQAVQDDFIDLAERLGSLKGADLQRLTIALPAGRVDGEQPDGKGIF